jgi:DNA polymerase-3 subunit epsilon/ATP-dependent DNA helicase DinG
MAKTYVALDLETTGLDPAKDAIIEIGALLFRGDRELESFSTFVDPGRNIPYFVTELTGITNADVKGAPPLSYALRRLTDFVGRSTIIGHSIYFDLSFLRRHDALKRNHAIDTFELANILVPHAARYSLENLTRELGIQSLPQTHRALDDARMAFELFKALLERAIQLPQQTSKEIIRLGRYVNWHAVEFFREAQYRRRMQGFSGGIGAQLASRRGGDTAGPLFLTEELAKPLEPRSEPLPLDVEALTSLLTEERSPLSKAFPEYEYRPQQVEMLHAVAQAFNKGHHLLVEAGTGTGKSLAYLLPALHWAVHNGQHVVISTNTINLQEQLANNDIPKLAEFLPLEFRHAVLKGRSHYLCRRQFEAMRHRGPANIEEMRVLARVLIWLPHTLDGDGDDLFLPTPEDRAVWYNISATSENCNPKHCRFFTADVMSPGDTCFFYRAREKAEAAHLIIVNHALLLADIMTQNRVLPDYHLLVVDEAHHLEHATTDALRYSASWYTLNQALTDLLRGRGRFKSERSFPGLLNILRDAAGDLPRKTQHKLLDIVNRLEDTAEHTQRRLEDVFNVLDVFLEENTGNRDHRYSTRLRITDSLRKQPTWDSVEINWSQAEPPFASLTEDLNQITRAIEEIEREDLEQIKASFVATTRRLTEAYFQLRHFIVEPGENYIYWLESRKKRSRRSGSQVSVNAVPLRVGPLVREHLFEKKHAVVLTSATLQTGGSFDYLRDRLDAWDARALSVGSPFDYKSAALLYIVNDIPQPGTHGHQKTVEQTLISLFKATEGRALALFTSYSQLQTTARAITSPLGQEDITVHAQGDGSSRAQLLENFREGERTVLLGTRSFWEGVDVPGEALSCLVIVKLPFDVPSDPIVAARSEDYEDSFNEYMVPEAILRFLQGFGRLIRTREDRGIVVVLDSRLKTKRYGQRFLNSLPDPLLKMGRRSTLPEIAARWLAGEPLPDEPLINEREPWSVPPPEEPPW